MLSMSEYKNGWSSTRQGAPARALARYSIVVFLFVLHSAFFIQPVNAQSCPRSFAFCSGQCVAPSANQGTACTVSGQSGTYDACGVCSGLSCGAGKVSCNGTCQDPASACPSGSNRSYDSCSGCGGCASGFTDCDIGATAYSCVSNSSSSCPAPQVYDPCTGTCTTSYVKIHPST